MKRISILPLLLLAIGCGDPNAKTAAQRAGAGNSLSGEAFKVIANDGLDLVGDRAAGSGAVAFLTPRTQDANSYEVVFTLADAGSLTVVTNAGADLTNGVEAVFTRSGTKLTVTCAAVGQPSDVSARFAAVDAAGEIALVLDIHNNETPVHAMAWKAGDSYTDGAALFNSTYDTELAGNGAGRIWGLRLANAVVTAAKADAAKFAE